MTITAGDVITRARQLLADEAEDEAIIDNSYYAPLNRAQEQLIKDRPELMVSSTGVSETYVAADALDDDLLWPDNFLKALAEYVAYDILSDDSHDRANREESEFRYDRNKREIST